MAFFHSFFYFFRPWPDLSFNHSSSLFYIGAVISIFFLMVLFFFFVLELLLLKTTHSCLDMGSVLLHFKLGMKNICRVRRHEEGTKKSHIHLALCLGTHTTLCTSDSFQIKLPEKGTRTRIIKNLGSTHMTAAMNLSKCLRLGCSWAKVPYTHTR